MSLSDITAGITSIIIGRSLTCLLGGVKFFCLVRGTLLSRKKLCRSRCTRVHKPGSSYSRAVSWSYRQCFFLFDKLISVGMIKFYLSPLVLIFLWPLVVECVLAPYPPLWEILADFIAAATAVATLIAVAAADNARRCDLGDELVGKQVFSASATSKVTTWSSLALLATIIACICSLLAVGAALMMLTYTRTVLPSSIFLLLRLST